MIQVVECSRFPSLSMNLVTSTGLSNPFMRQYGHFTVTVPSGDVVAYMSAFCRRSRAVSSICSDVVRFLGNLFNLATNGLAVDEYTQDNEHQTGCEPEQLTNHVT